MPKLQRLMIALLSLALLNGCASQYAVIATEQLCQSWRHQTVSKHDKLTDKTASGIEGSNNARPAWGCQPGGNRAL